MRIIRHRCNTKAEIRAACEAGDDFECDVRFGGHGETHLAHDRGEKVGTYACATIVMVLNEYPAAMAFVNPKEGGIVERLVDNLPSEIAARCVLVDASANETRYAEKNSKLKGLNRISLNEYNSTGSGGAWWDYPYRADTKTLFESAIYLVSPELHGLPLTDGYIEAMVQRREITGVCTDEWDRWRAAINER